MADIWCVKQDMDSTRMLGKKKKKRFWYSIATPEELLKLVLTASSNDSEKFYFTKIIKFVSQYLN